VERVNCSKGIVRRSEHLGNGEVGPAEAVGRSVTAHELVVVVDVDHVVHRAEVSVFLDPGSGFHPGNGLLKEVPNLSGRALVSAVEVLASVFGDPNVGVEGVVPVGDVVNELLNPDIVPVDGEEVDGAALASVDEVVHPVLSGGSRGSSGSAETVTLSLEGLHATLPEVGGRAGINSGGKVPIAEQVGLVHTESSASVTRLARFSDEIVQLVPSPEHGNTLDAKGWAVVGAVGRPSVDPADALPLVEISWAIGPGGTFFAGAGGAVVGSTVATVITAASAAAVAAVSAVASVVATVVTGSSAGLRVSLRSRTSLAPLLVGVALELCLVSKGQVSGNVGCRVNAQGGDGGHA